MPEVPPQAFKGTKLRIFAQTAKFFTRAASAIPVPPPDSIVREPYGMIKNVSQWRIRVLRKTPGLLVFVEAIAVLKRR